MLMPEIWHFLVVNFQWSTSVHCTAPVAKMAVPNGPAREKKIAKSKESKEIPGLVI